MVTIGIDFGTTNSAVAVFRPDTGEVLTTEYEPTVIFFEESNDQIYHVGRTAIQKYVASGLKGRFIRSIKSILHSETFKSTYIYGKKYKAEDLVALVLKHLAGRAEELLGFRPERVIIGRPARFSPHPRKDALAESRLLKAAQLVGFKDIHFQLEPIAAAYSYEHGIQRDELVFVGDFGGGTADFTLMRLGPERAVASTDRMNDILGSSGVRVGGDDFDAEIAWGKVIKELGYGLEYDANGLGKWLPMPSHFYLQFCRWENHFLLMGPTSIREIEKYYDLTKESPKLGNLLRILKENMGYALFRKVEEGKIELSKSDLAEIDFDQSGIVIRESLTIGEFERFIGKQMGKLSETVDELLQETGVNASEIDAVFLTGGTSLVRPVRQLMASKFSLGKIREEDAFTSVSKGLALYSKFLN